MRIEKTEINPPYEKFNCKKDATQAMLTAYVDDSDEQVSPAVIVCPGGAYFFLFEGEGEPVAREYQKAGLKTFMLEYSVQPNTFPAALMEVALAIKYVRDNCEKYKVNPNEIYICGFSAGGHLCASTGTLYKEEFLNEALGTTKDEIKPNGMILNYPVITAGEYTHRDSCINLLGRKDVENSEYFKYISLEKVVDKETAPTFIWTTLWDNLVPMENSMLFVQALKNAGVDVEFHMFPKGDHGLSVANEELEVYKEQKAICDYVCKWVPMSVDFIKHRKE